MDASSQYVRVCCLVSLDFIQHTRTERNAICLSAGPGPGPGLGTVPEPGSLARHMVA
jgi:hypothetical protein